MGADFSLCVQEDLPRRTRWLITNDHPSSPPRCLFQQCVAKCVDYVVAHTARSFGGSELTISVNTRASSRPLCLQEVTSLSMALSNAFREYNVRFTTVDLSQCATTLVAWDIVTIAKALAAVSYSKFVCGSGGQEGSPSPSPNPIRSGSTEDVQWRRLRNGNSSSSSSIGVSSIYDTFRRSGEIFVGDGSGLDAEAHWCFSSLKIDNHRGMGIDHLRSIAEAFAPPPSFSSSSVGPSSGTTQASIVASVPPVITISLQNTSFAASDVTALAWKCASWLVLERGEPCRWAPRIAVEGEFVEASGDSESKLHETEPPRAASSPRRRGRIATSWRQSQVAAQQQSSASARSYSASSVSSTSQQKTTATCISPSASPEPANTGNKVSPPSAAAADEEHDFYLRERSVSAAPAASYSGRTRIPSTDFVEQGGDQKRSADYHEDCLGMHSDLSVSAGNSQSAAALILAAVGEEADGWSPARLGIEHSPPPPTSTSSFPADSFRPPVSSHRQSGDVTTIATADGRVSSSSASAPTRSPSPSGTEKGEENASKKSLSDRNRRGTSGRMDEVDHRFVATSPSHSPHEEQEEENSRYSPLIQSISNRAFALSEFTARRILEWHLEIGQLEARLSALHDFASRLESTKSDESSSTSYAPFFESIKSDALNPLRERLAFFKKEELALLSGKAHAWLQVVFSLVEFAEGVVASSSSSRSEPVSDFMEQLANTGLGDSEVAPLLEVLSCQPKKRELMRSLAVEGDLVELLRNGKMNCRMRSRQEDVEGQEEDEWMMASSGSSSPRAKPMSPMSISMGVLFVGRLLSNFCNSAAERDVLGPFSAAMEGSLSAVHKHCVEYHFGNPIHAEEDEGGEGEEEQRTERPNQTAQREVEGFSRSQVTLASRSVSPTPGQKQQQPAASTSARHKESLVFSLVEKDDVTEEEEEETDVRNDQQLEGDAEARLHRQSRTEQRNEAACDSNSSSGRPRSGSTSRFPHYMKPLGSLGGHGAAAVAATAKAVEKDYNARVNTTAINTHESVSSLDDNNNVAADNNMAVNLMPPPPPTLLLRVPTVPPSVGSLLSGRSRSPSPTTSTTVLRRQSTTTAVGKGEVRQQEQEDEEIQPSGNTAPGGSSFGANKISHQDHHDYFTGNGHLRPAAGGIVNVDASSSGYVEGMSKGIPLLPKPFDVEDDDEERNGVRGKAAKRGGAGLKLLFKKSEGAVTGVGVGDGGAMETVGSTRSTPPPSRANTPNDKVTIGFPRMTLAVTARIERLKLQQEKERKARERVDNSKRFANVSPKVSSRRNAFSSFSSASTPTASPRTTSPHVGSTTNPMQRDGTEDPINTKNRPQTAMRYFMSSSNIPSTTALSSAVATGESGTKLVRSQDASHKQQQIPSNGRGDLIIKVKSSSSGVDGLNGNALLQRALRVTAWNDSVAVPTVTASERRSALRSTALLDEVSKERSLSRRYGDEHSRSAVRAEATRERERGGSSHTSRSASRSQHRSEHHHENIVSTVALMRQAHEKACAEAEQKAGEGHYNFTSRGTSSSSSLQSFSTQHLMSEFEKLSEHVQDALKKDSTNERRISAAKGSSSNGASTEAQAMHSQPQASTAPPPQPQARAATGVRSGDGTSTHKVLADSKREEEKSKSSLTSASLNTTSTPKEHLTSPAALANLLFPSSTSYAASPLNVAAPPKRKEVETNGSGAGGGLSYFVSSSSRSSRSPSLMRGGSEVEEINATKSSGALPFQRDNNEAPQRATIGTSFSGCAALSTSEVQERLRSADEPSSFTKNNRTNGDGSGGRGHTFLSDAALRTITNNAVEAGLDRRAARKHTANPAEYFSLRPQLNV